MNNGPALIADQGIVNPPYLVTAPPPSPVTVGETERSIADVLPAMMRQAPVGVGVMRRDRWLAYHNDALARILRAPDPTGPIRLQPVHSPDGTSFSPDREPLQELLRTGRPLLRRAVVLIRDDGSRADSTITATPIVDAANDVLGAVLYVDDPTPDADDVSFREAFMGVLSHELRTPITAIYGGTQLLLNDRLSADLRATITTDIAAEAEQLHRLVEDLLAIAQVERGLVATGTEPVLLQRLARQAGDAEERRWPGRRVLIEDAPDLPAARADDGYTMQILRNLISNAVKYSPPGEPVTVSLHADQDVVHVSVLDRGAGFPAGTGPDAFRLFHRSPAVAAHVSGTGIGLYVARALVEAQGGRIWLRNRADGGAEVGFSLPVYRIDGAT
jgi:signal transduction histidine kinase